MAHKAKKLVRLRNGLLPSPEILRDCISAIIQAFENVGEMEVLKIRWEEIKRLQLQPQVVV